MNDTYPSRASARYEDIAAENKRDHLSRSSLTQQAEAIARHYLSHANTARDLLEIVEIVRDHGGSCARDAVMARLVDGMKRDHRHDFGIALEWPKIDPVVDVLAQRVANGMDFLSSTEGARQLSDEAAFSAAVTAGVPIECSRNEAGNFVMKLAHPVSAIMEDGVIKVFHAHVSEGL